MRGAGHGCVCSSGCPQVLDKKHHRMPWALPARARLEPGCPCTSPSPSMAVSMELHCALLLPLQLSQPPGLPGGVRTGVRGGVSAGQHLLDVLGHGGVANDVENSSTAARLQPTCKPSPPAVKFRAPWSHWDGFLC